MDSTFTATSTSTRAVKVKVQVDVNRLAPIGGSRVSRNFRALRSSFENVKRSEGLSSGRALDRMARRR
jgi:hypothetical protein